MATTNAVNIGKGRATGMFLTAAAGTALPASLDNATITAWGSVIGYVSDAGVTLNLSNEKETIKDWSTTVRRVVVTDHEESVSGTCISTDTTALTALFGTGAVSSSGTPVTTTVNLSTGTLPAEAAYLFAIVDGDDIIAFGCPNGQLSVADNVSFTAGDAIEWPFEVVATGTTGMTFIKTNGA